MIKQVTIILLFVALGVICKEECYYSTLKVKRNADIKVLKKAYKSLLIKYHPDKNQSKEKWAKKQFIKVSEAYDVLKDPKKRNIYDRYGHEGIKNFDQHGDSNRQSGGGMGGMNMDDIINTFFGGGGGGRRKEKGRGRRERRERRNHQFGHEGRTQDGFGFQQGDDGENYEQQQEQAPKKLLEHENFINIDSEEMLPDFDNLKEAYGLYLYRPEHTDRNKQSDGLTSTKKLQMFVEKFGELLKVGVLDCTIFEVVCSRIQAKHAKTHNMKKSLYLVFGTKKRFQKIDLGRPDVNLNNIVKTHVRMMNKVVIRLRKELLKDFLARNVNKKIVLLFTNKPMTSLLFLSLANAFKDLLVFAEIHVSQTEIYQKFKIDPSKAPKLVFLKDSISLEYDEYTSQMKRGLLIMYFNQKIIEVNSQSKKAIVFSEDIFKSGQCGVKDPIFCVLVVSNSKSQSDKYLERLNDILKAYPSEPVKFFVTQQVTGFKSLFDSNGIVFLKGKRKKFKALENEFKDVSDEEFKNFIDLGVSGGMLSLRYSNLDSLFN